MSPSQCPSGWDIYEDHCYRFIQKDASWSAAEVDCKSSGGDLVKIDNLKENEWIKNQTKEKSMRDPWIGLYEYNHNDWRWVVDLQVPLFFGWYKTLIFDQPSGDGNCCQLRESLEFNWNDEPCNKEYNYICKRSWGCWQAVGQCSATCGNGTQLRVRECDNPAPTYEGPTCEGNDSSNDWCNIRDCPVFKWGYLKEMNLTKSELLETLKTELNELQANLTGDAKNTSAAIRLRTSARDDRPSAASVGYVAIVLLSIPFILMICCDCTRLFQKNGRKAVSKVEEENEVQNNESEAGPTNGTGTVQRQKR